MIRVFIGYDPRQPLAYNVMQHSIVRNASVPVAITPLILNQLPIKRRGLTEFTYSRFLVPALCDFQGLAVFADADIVVRGDIRELIDAVGENPGHSVYVNKLQERFEWPSVMVFDCGRCRDLTPAYIDDAKNALFDFAWAEDGVGGFPAEWNHCVGYEETRDDAKLFHYTQGLPCFVETAGLPEDAYWHDELKRMKHTVSWRELMGSSIHAKHVLKRFLSRYATEA